tara:strand:+ start:822 stop:1133 length:312 start_codon:yes stop_codon:yes gene_type:complete
MNLDFELNEKEVFLALLPAMMSSVSDDYKGLIIPLLLAEGDEHVKEMLDEASNETLIAVQAAAMATKNVMKLFGSKDNFDSWLDNTADPVTAKEKMIASRRRG